MLGIKIVVTGQQFDLREEKFFACPMEPIENINVHELKNLLYPLKKCLVTKLTQVNRDN